MVMKPESFKSQLIERFVPVLAGNSNGKQFKRRSWLHVLTFELTGELAVTVANATLLEDGILRLLKKLVFNLVGDVSPFSVSGRLLHRINSYVNSERERVSQPAVTFATSPNAFRASWDLHFIMPDFFIPEGFKLNTLLFKGQEIANPVYDTVLGAVTDVATPGGGGTVALQNLQFNVYAKDENGDEIGMDRENEIHEELQFVTDLVVATEAAGTIDIRDNNKLRRIALLVRNNAGGALSDSVVDRIKIVRNSSDVVHEWLWADIQSKNKKEYQLTDELFNAIKTGFAIVNLDQDFNLAGLMDTRKAKGVKTLDLVIVPVAGQTALVDASREVILVKG